MVLFIICIKISNEAHGIYGPSRDQGKDCVRAVSSPQSKPASVKSRVQQLQTAVLRLFLMIRYLDAILAESTVYAFTIILLLLGERGLEKRWRSLKIFRSIKIKRKTFVGEELQNITLLASKCDLEIDITFVLRSSVGFLGPKILPVIKKQLVSAPYLTLNQDQLHRNLDSNDSKVPDFGFFSYNDIKNKDLHFFERSQSRGSYGRKSESDCEYVSIFLLVNIGYQNVSRSQV